MKDIRYIPFNFNEVEGNGSHVKVMIGNKTISFNLKKPHKSNKYFIDIYDDEMKPIIKGAALGNGMCINQGIIDKRLPEGYEFIVIPVTLHGLKNELIYPNFEDNYKIAILEVKNEI